VAYLVVYKYLLRYPPTWLAESLFTLWASRTSLHRRVNQMLVSRQRKVAGLDSHCRVASGPY
jgi:hypothetical protein